MQWRIFHRLVLLWQNSIRKDHDQKDHGRDEEHRPSAHASMAHDHEVDEMQETSRA